MDISVKDLGPEMTKSKYDGNHYDRNVDGGHDLQGVPK